MPPGRTPSPASQAPMAQAPDWVPRRELPPNSQSCATEEGNLEISQQAFFPQHLESLHDNPTISAWIHPVTGHSPLPMLLDHQAIWAPLCFRFKYFQSQYLVHGPSNAPRKAQKPCLSPSGTSVRDLRPQPSGRSWQTWCCLFGCFLSTYYVPGTDLGLFYTACMPLHAPSQLIMQDSVSP